MTGTRSLVVGFGLLVAGPATAGDYESWYGGFVGTGLQYVQGAGLGTVLSQVEFDYRASTGDWFFRVDLDYHFNPVFFSDGIDDAGAYFTPHYPYPPEYAVVQWAPGKFRLRMGVTNPNMGMQVWDERGNYLPTYTNGWYLQNSQNLGIEPGFTFDDGTDVFVWAGYDIGWLTPAFGAGVQTEQDFFGTWTGAFYMPWLQYAGLWSSNEIYPADALWLTLEINAGVAGSDVIGGGQFVANIFPDSVVSGAVRFEKQFYTDGAAEHLGFDLDSVAIAGAVKSSPTDWLFLALEGKESFPRNGGDPYFTGTFYVAVGTPGEAYEDYDVHDEE